MFVNTRSNALKENNTDKCDTAAADFQSKETAHHGVGTEDLDSGQICSLVSSLFLLVNEDTDNTQSAPDGSNQKACADSLQTAGDTITFPQIADTQNLLRQKLRLCKRHGYRLYPFKTALQ